MSQTQQREQPPEVAWRLERLLKLGFNQVQARRLYDRPDVEHEARELLDAGCDPTNAYRILRE